MKKIKKVKYCHPPRNSLRVEQCSECGHEFLVAHIALFDPALHKRKKVVKYGKIYA